MASIRPARDDELYAALQVPRILNEVFQLAQLTWICRWCGAHTTCLSEYCAGCHREDLDQGIR